MAQADARTAVDGSGDPRLRIVVGSDDAGLRYKGALKADLEADDRVAEVVDVGVTADEDAAYPHVAVEAARMIADGEASGRLPHHCRDADRGHEPASRLKSDRSSDSLLGSARAMR